MAKQHQVAFEIAGKINANFNRSFGSAGAEMQKLSQQIAKLSSTNGATSRLHALENQTQELKQQWKDAAAKATELGRKIATTGAPTKTMIRDFERAKASSERLEAAFIKSSRTFSSKRTEIIANAQALKTLKQRQSELMASQEKAIALENRMAAATKKATAAVEGQSKAMKIAGKMREGFSRASSMVAFSRRAAVTTVALSAIPAYSIKQAEEYEHQLQQIANTTGMTVENQQKLNSEIQLQSRLTNQKTTELTGGVGFMIAAGLEEKVARSRETISTLGKTVTATGSAVEDVAKTIMAVNQNLNIQPTGFSQAMNIALSASKAGNIEFRDMANNLPQITAQAQTLGITGAKGLASLAAAAEVARMGAGSAEEAFNNQKNFLAKLTSKEAAGNFAHAGINLETELEKAKKSGDVILYMLEVIQKKTKGNKFAQGALFADMQVNNFLNPMLANLDKYKQIRDEALSSDGMVDTDFNKMMATTKEQMKATQIAAEQTTLTLGKSLLPVFQELLQKLTPLILKVAEWINQNPELTRNIMLGVAALGGLAVVLPLVAAGITLLATPAGWATMAIAEVAALVVRLKEEWNGWIDLVSRNPIFELIASQIKGALDFLDKLGTKLEDVYNNIKNYFSGNGTIKQPQAQVVSQLQQAQSIRQDRELPAAASVNRNTSMQYLQNGAADNSKKLDYLVAMQSDKLRKEQPVNVTNTFNPQITIQGSADKQVLDQSLSKLKNDFNAQMREWQARQKRLAF